MAEPYYISDLHFFHANILLHDARPFSTIEEHDATIIKNINETVPAGSPLYILGDLSLCNKTKLASHLRQITVEEMILIKGNHDVGLSNTFLRMWFTEVYDYHVMKYAGKRLVLCHYPLESWDGKEHETIHLHGHCHGRSHHRDLHAVKNRLDVGANVIGYKPISFTQAIEGTKEYAPYFVE